MSARPATSRAGAILLGGLILLALAAPWIAPYDPAAAVGRPFETPSARHWLGTNDIGQDLLSELLVATRISLGVGLAVAGCATAMATVVGLLAGYARGRVDALLMRLVDVTLVVPFLPFLILLAAYIGMSQWQIVPVMAVLLWARPARVIRARTLSAAALDHVLAARALGARPIRVVRHHLLPEVAPVVIAQFVLLASQAIAAEAALSFLGLGDPTHKSWGAMLFYAQARHAFLTGHWIWWVIPPGAMITLSVVSFALIGMGRERHALRSRT